MAIHDSYDQCEPGIRDKPRSEDNFPIEISTPKHYKEYSKLRTVNCLQWTYSVKQEMYFSVTQIMRKKQIYTNIISRKYWFGCYKI
jgi:hypothetical protein